MTASDTEYDLVIRGGKVVDGSGAPGYRADVAISDGIIQEIGPGPFRGREEIDAEGCMVTPGFVDIHTHFDGQIAWENTFSPVSSHGVTTLVMGNCGVGFAPCTPEVRPALMTLMEGVEDIPEAVMAEGMAWEWETFPEYLDFLDTREADTDFATQVPHNPVRAYVMGDRAMKRERATKADMTRMAEVVREAVEAGALGFTTTRFMAHRSRDGTLAPTVTAGEDELRAITRALGEADAGVIEVSDFFDDTTDEYSTDFEMWVRLARESGRPLTFGLVQVQNDPDRWRRLLKFSREANESGVKIAPQVIPRPVGVLFGLSLSSHPFSFCPSYEEIAHLPLEERLSIMSDPDFRAKLLGETPKSSNDFMLNMTRNVEGIFELGSEPDYFPPKDESLAARAEAQGISPLELAYDLLLKDGGRALLYYPITNFAYGSSDVVSEMLHDEHSLIGIGDGGAHMGLVCDASVTTYLLTYWSRDRSGERFSVEAAIKKLTSDNAEFYGLRDRGLLKPGYKADVNVIDFEKLRLHSPYSVNDLPTGALRLTQPVDGYVATIVSGVVTRRDGVATGKLPGRLVRGKQPAPSEPKVLESA